MDFDITVAPDEDGLEAVFYSPEGIEFGGFGRDYFETLVGVPLLGPMTIHCHLELPVGLTA